MIRMFLATAALAVTVSAPVVGELTPAGTAETGWGAPVASTVDIKEETGWGNPPAPDPSPTDPASGDPASR
ncbi:hypothetical protein O7606_17510 [Micromonospora sp. WMMD882]|uniref:hypothetical protein n=1 Tax=Micromonospora sp. WMMD882 TaxID=3015151 RepID=UPI00248D1E60|nr:hypothetical protein [Micromonospora sp. WMMD882]WBB78042.1 hypothetical protein O7606_17510 [Micromonospora sp. WMMD882]